MVRLSTSILAASLLAVPALALSSTQYERSVAESDLYGRDIADLENVILTRGDLNAIFGRELINAIEERSPINFGAVFKAGKKLVGMGKKAQEAHGHGSSSHLEHSSHQGYAHHAHSAIEHVNNNYNPGPSQGYDYSQQQQQPSPYGRREFDEEEFDLRDFDEALFTREYFDDLD